MRILSLVNTLWASGVTKAALDQALALRKLGHDARILAFVASPEDNSDFLAPFIGKIPIIQLSNCKIRQPYLKLATDRVIAKRIAAKENFSFLNFKPDVLISHNFAFAQTASRIARTFRAKFILFIYDAGGISFHYLHFPYWITGIRLGIRSPRLGFHPPNYAIQRAIKLEQNLIREADLVITQSNVVAKLIKRTYLTDEPLVNHLGTHPAPLIPEQREDFVLIGGTALEPGRDFQSTFKACALAKAKVVLVGRVTYGTNLVLDQLKKSGVKNYKVYSLKTGFSKWASRARVFVNYHFEHFGLPTVEAASHGCPIIQNRKSGSSELFVHGVSGFFPERQDVDLYATYIAELMADERKAWRMGKHAWETLKQKYTWEMHAKRLLNFLEKVV